MDPHLVYVIPNAIISEKFTPDPTLADPSCSTSSGELCHILSLPDKTESSAVTIVVVSRLVCRKGVDLLVAAIPHVCEMFPNVRFIIGERQNVSS